MVGISNDDPRTQCEFADAMAVKFPLIGDHDEDVIDAFAVAWPVLRLARRVTYLIDRDLTVLSVFQHEIMATRHVEDVLAALTALQAPS